MDRTGSAAAPGGHTIAEVEGASTHCQPRAVVCARAAWSALASQQPGCEMYVAKSWAATAFKGLHSGQDQVRLPRRVAHANTQPAQCIARTAARPTSRARWQRPKQNLVLEDGFRPGRRLGKAFSYRLFLLLVSQNGRPYGMHFVTTVCLIT